eukprot:g16836.t1
MPGCHSCGAPEAALFQDTRIGAVCTKCGVVQKTNLIDSGQDWRSFVNTKHLNQRVDRSVQQRDRLFQKFGLASCEFGGVGATGGGGGRGGSGNGGSATGMLSGGASSAKSTLFSVEKMRQLGERLAGGGGRGVVAARSRTGAAAEREAPAADRKGRGRHDLELDAQENDDVDEAGLESDALDFGAAAAHPPLRAACRGPAPPGGASSASTAAQSTLECHLQEADAQDGGLDALFQDADATVRPQQAGTRGRGAGGKKSTTSLGRFEGDPLEEPGCGYARLDRELQFVGALQRKLSAADLSEQRNRKSEVFLLNEERLKRFEKLSEDHGFSVKAQQRAVQLLQQVVWDFPLSLSERGFASVETGERGFFFAILWLGGCLEGEGRSRAEIEELVELAFRGVSGRRRASSRRNGVSRDAEAEVESAEPGAREGTGNSSGGEDGDEDFFAALDDGRASDHPVLEDVEDDVAAETLAPVREDDSQQDPAEAARRKMPRKRRKISHASYVDVLRGNENEKPSDEVVEEASCAFGAEDESEEDAFGTLEADDVEDVRLAEPDPVVHDPKRKGPRPVAEISALRVRKLLKGLDETNTNSARTVSPLALRRVDSALLVVESWVKRMLRALAKGKELREELPLLPAPASATSSRKIFLPAPHAATIVRGVRDFVIRCCERLPRITKSPGPEGGATCFARLHFRRLQENAEGPPAFVGGKGDAEDASWQNGKYVAVVETTGEGECETTEQGATAEEVGANMDVERLALFLFDQLLAGDLENVVATGCERLEDFFAPEKFTRYTPGKRSRGGHPDKPSFSLLLANAGVLAVVSGILAGCLPVSDHVLDLPDIFRCVEKATGFPAHEFVPPRSANSQEYKSGKWFVAVVADLVQRAGKKLHIQSGGPRLAVCSVDAVVPAADPLVDCKKQGVSGAAASKNRYARQLSQKHRADRQSRRARTTRKGLAAGSSKQSAAQKKAQAPQPIIASRTTTRAPDHPDHVLELDAPPPSGPLAASDRHDQPQPSLREVARLPIRADLWLDVGRRGSEGQHHTDLWQESSGAIEVESVPLEHWLGRVCANLQQLHAHLQRHVDTWR